MEYIIKSWTVKYICQLIMVDLLYIILIGYNNKVFEIYFILIFFLMIANHMIIKNKIYYIIRETNPGILKKYNIIFKYSTYWDWKILLAPNKDEFTKRIANMIRVVALVGLLNIPNIIITFVLADKLLK